MLTKFSTLLTLLGAVLLVSVAPLTRAPIVGLGVVARMADTLVMRVTWTQPPLDMDQHPIARFHVTLVETQTTTVLDSVVVAATEVQHDFLLVRNPGDDLRGFVGNVWAEDTTGAVGGVGTSPRFEVPAVGTSPPSPPVVAVDTTLILATADSFRLWPEVLRYDATDWFLQTLYGQVFGEGLLVVCRAYDVIQFDPPVFDLAGRPCPSQPVEWIVEPNGDTTLASILLDGLALTVTADGGTGSQPGLQLGG